LDHSRSLSLTSSLRSLPISFGLLSRPSGGSLTFLFGLLLRSGARRFSGLAHLLSGFAGSFRSLPISFGLLLELSRLLPVFLIYKAAMIFVRLLLLLAAHFDHALISYTASYTELSERTVDLRNMHKLSSLIYAFCAPCCLLFGRADLDGLMDSKARCRSKHSDKSYRRFSYRRF
jgi:hypothetical protein